MAQNEKALQSEIPLIGFTDSGCLLTSSGDVGCVVRLDGIDPDCLPEKYADAITQSIEAANRAFDNRSIVYQVYMRRREKYAVDGEERGVLGLMSRSRADHLNRVGIYSEDLFYVFLCLDPRSQRSLWRAFRQHELFDYCRRRRHNAVDFYADEIAATEREARRRADLFVRQMDAVVDMKIAAREESFRCLRRLILAEDGYTPQRIEDCELDYELGGANLRRRAESLDIGTNHTVLLAMKRLPESSWPMMFGAFRKVEGDFHIVTTWQSLAPGESSKEARKRMGHFGKRIREGRQSEKARGDEAIKNAENVQVVDDLKDIQKRIAQGAYLGWFSLVAAAYGPEEFKVKETVADLQKVFLSHQAELIVHTENQENLFISTLPGGYARPCHRFLMENRDYANLAMWEKASSGRERNEHLNSGPLLVMRSTSGTAYNFHLHGPREFGLDDLANTVGIGRPGSGKTVLQNLIIAAAQRLTPKPRTLILDIDNSFEGITQAFGGRYVRIEPGASTFRVNPFAQEKTLEHKDFLLRFIRCLVEFGTKPLSRAEEQIVLEGIDMLYAMPRSLRTLSQFAKGLPGQLQMGLAKWVDGGHYASYFDNAEDEFTLAEFQTVNFSKDLAKEVMVACPMWILHQEDRVIQDDSLSNVLKLVAIDEAKVLFEYKVLMEYALHVERRGRKRNAPLFLMSQLVDDFEGEAAGVRKMSSTQIYLSQPSADGDYRDGFALKPEEIQVIRSLPRGVIYVKQGPGRGKILEVCLDPVAEALCRTDSDWKIRRREMFERLGPEEALRQMSKGGTL